MGATGQAAFLTVLFAGAVTIACSSSEGGNNGGLDASMSHDSGTGGHPASGGSAGSGGLGGSGGIDGSTGAQGTGCVFGADAAAETLTSTGSKGARADASTDASAARDASTDGGKTREHDGAAPRDAAPDTGPEKDSGPVKYPPLQFPKIGKPVQVSGQFLFTEGPIWDPAKQVLYFTDINADTIYRLTLPNTFDAFLKPMGNADGLALDPEGHLIAAGFVSRDIWRLDGIARTTLADHYRGEKLNSPDDLIARSDGVIYFTDPTYGINGSQGFSAQPQELCFQGVYRIALDGTLHLEDDGGTAGPNGVELSPDEKTLYVSYTNSGEIYSFAVAPDGSLSQKTLFASNVSIADSMCVDAGGNLYVASLAGIAVFDPTGTHLGTIALSQVPTNGAFGGPDQRTFFITARTGLIGTPTAGNASLLRIDDMPIPGLPGRP